MAAAQADAHVCLLDALGIRQAAVVGGSAGATSALQMAIRHADRTSALVLRLIGSNFLFWAALHVAREQVI